VRPPTGAAASPRTWLLSATFVAVIGAAITGSRILWGPTAFENVRDLRHTAFGQTYQAARKIYFPARDALMHVALLGNSRIFVAAPDGLVRRELARIAPALDGRVDNLGIFGAGVGDLEVLSRHLGHLRPSLVVVTLGGTDVLEDPSSPTANVVARLLRIGWRDGPLEPRGQEARLDRWLRTAWPLYRFREFARAAIEDRVWPPPDDGPFPDHFPSTRAVFDYMHGEKGAQVEAAYRAWRARPTLAAFVAYLSVGSAGHLDVVRRRAREGRLPGPGADTVRALDALLERLGRGPGRALVLLMPENPTLELDVTGEYHRPGASDAAEALLEQTAARHRVPFVDGRRWMPAEAFVDFDHLLPELSGFQTPLVEEIVRALAT
jgi:hypothetical protein